MKTVSTGTGYRTTHPEYMAYVDRWKRMRDVIEGEDTIRRKGDLYLPKPGGIRDMYEEALSTMLDESKKGKSGQSAGVTRRQADEEWRAFLGRAQFPTWVRDSIRAMAGLVRKLDEEVELPASIEYLKESATGDGFTLEQLFVRIVIETLTYGRCALYVDIDETGRPYIALYSAFSLINWKESKGRDGNELRLVTLLEESEKGDDEFSHDTVNQWRVVSLDANGDCIVRVFSENGDIVNTVDGEIAKPMAFGAKPIKNIPIVVVGSRDNAPDVDDIPLEGMALASLAYYRVSADYYKALHMTSHPQLCTFGAEVDTLVGGPGLVWGMAADARVEYVEASGSGIEKQRYDMERQKQQAAEIGARTMDASGVESGDARKARQDDQRATLSTVVTTASQGIERALKYAAEMAGVNPDEVSYNVKPDFDAHDVDSNMVGQLSSLLTMQAISPETVFEYLKTGKMPDRDYSDELMLIRDQSGTLGNPSDEVE